MPGIPFYFRRDRVDGYEATIADYWRAIEALVGLDVRAPEAPPDERPPGLAVPRAGPNPPPAGPWDSVVPGGTGRTYSGGSHGGKPAVDIFAAAGTPILAPRSGTSYPAVYSLGGFTTTLHADTGKYYYFAHALTPMRGGRVTQGDQIGQVGASGNAASTPAHLHLAVATELWMIAAWNGSGDLDPLDWI